MFDISNNRVRGIIDDHFVISTDQTSLGLAMNRLSGPLPRAVYENPLRNLSSLNILAGNIFSCDFNQIPVNDLYGKSYSCGSYEWNIAAYVYLGFVGVCLSILIVGYILWTKRNSRDFFVCSRFFHTLSDLAVHASYIYFACMYWWWISTALIHIYHKTSPKSPDEEVDEPLLQPDVENVIPDKQIDSSYQEEDPQNTKGLLRPPSVTNMILNASPAANSTTFLETRQTREKRASLAPSQTRNGNKSSKNEINKAISDNFETHRETTSRISQEPINPAEVSKTRKTNRSNDSKSQTAVTDTAYNMDDISVETPFMDEFMTKDAISSLSSSAQLYTMIKSKSPILPETKAFLIVLEGMVYLTITLGLLLLLIIVPTYVGLAYSSSMVTYQYGYVLSMAYLHDIGPVIFVSIVITILLLLMTYFILKLSSILSSYHNQANNDYEMVTIESHETMYMGSWIIRGYEQQSYDRHQKIVTWTSKWKYLSRIILLHSINLAIVCVFDGFYVNAILSDQSITRVQLFYIQGCVGVFSLLWDSMYVPWALKQIERGMSKKQSMSHRLMMSLAIFIIAPCITTALINPSCFYYVFR